MDKPKINIYNSLKRKKEIFEPINFPQVNLYTCGVTVYDECHIGHARSLYIFDVIRRYLEYRGFKVNFVRNITDIDDKIINRANELKADWQELVKKYIDRYYEDSKLLGIEKADFEPRATENIPDMVKYIGQLIEKGFAYESSGDVYFNVRKSPDYGKLSGQSIDHMEKGVRIDPSENKKDPLDFALWKKSKENEPAWDSPWSKGRPGWHIECSVMSRKFLKTDTLDIHAGGRDLIFPHHENEIAQSEAAGKKFARYWLHHGLLTINGQKMSKSLGNFVTVRDFIAKYKNPDFLKMFFLSAHYSSPIDYSEEKIEEARKALERLSILLRKSQRIVRKTGIKSVLENTGFIEEHKSNFFRAMDDNFNTPQAMGSLFELANDTNKFIDSEADAQEYVEVIHQAAETIWELSGKIFGLFLDTAEWLTPEEKKLLEEREKARQNKNYHFADKIRKELEQKGIILEDTKDGKATWRRKL